jgi:hypothetical protein
MKAHERNKMTDDEIYLSRLLKNWAGQQQAPAELRERILHKAAAPPRDPSQRFSRSSRKNTFSLNLYRPISGWWLGPFTDTRTWSFHLATTLRQVA